MKTFCAVLLTAFICITATTAFCFEVSETLPPQPFVGTKWEGLSSVSDRGIKDIPENFASRADAKKFGCRFAPLKKKDKPNAVTAGVDQDNYMVFCIYDEMPGGKYLLKDRIKVAYRNEYSDCCFVDITGEGTVFLCVTFDAGSGRFHMKTALYGWNRDRFQPVVLETASFHVKAYKEERDLNLILELKKMEVNSYLFISYYHSYKHSDGLSGWERWTDVLKWEDEKFRFVPYKMKAESTLVRQKIAEARRKFQSNPPVKDISHDYLQQNGFMELFDIN